MTTIEHNGNNWYTDARSIARRCLEWIWSKPRKELTPMSFFGHRLNFYGWGADLKTRRGSLVISRTHGHDPNWRAYHSTDGTPARAFTIVWKRRGRPERMLRVTLEEAKLRGFVTPKSKWSTDPKSMLIAMAEREGARIGFPECVAGMRCKEEMEDTGIIEGEVM